MHIDEPKNGILMACEIHNGNFLIGGSQWEKRTYEVRRTRKGWLADFGMGESEHFQSWENVLIWFEAMKPRNVETISW